MQYINKNKKERKKGIEGKTEKREDLFLQTYRTASMKIDISINNSKREQELKKVNDKSIY